MTALLEKNKYKVARYGIAYMKRDAG